VQPQPPERNGPLDPGAKVVARTARREEWRVHPFNEDAAILCGFDGVRDLDQLAGRDIGISKGRDEMNFFTRRLSFVVFGPEWLTWVQLPAIALPTKAGAVIGLEETPWLRGKFPSKRNGLSSGGRLRPRRGAGGIGTPN
jgi:hypothetical protein